MIQLELERSFRREGLALIYNADGKVRKSTKQVEISTWQTFRTDKGNQQSSFNFDVITQCFKVQ